MARWVGKLATKEDLHRVETHLNAKVKKMNDKIDRADRFSKELCDRLDRFSKELCDRFDKMNDKLDRSLYILLGGMTVATGILSILIVALNG